MSLDNMTYKRVEMHFLFSFAFQTESFESLARALKQFADECERGKGLSLEVGVGNPGPQLRTEAPELFWRDGLSPILTYDGPYRRTSEKKAQDMEQYKCLYLLYRADRGRAESSRKDLANINCDKVEVEKVYVLIRFFESGAGTLTIGFMKNQPLLHEICLLQDLAATLDEDRLTLFAGIDELPDFVGSPKKSEHGSRKRTLFKGFENMIQTIESYFEISFPDYRQIFLWLDENRDSPLASMKTETGWQSPYVVTMCSLCPEDDDKVEPWWKNSYNIRIGNSVGNLYHEATLLLLRYYTWPDHISNGLQNIRTPNQLLTHDGHFRDMGLFWDQRGLLLFHKRSSLFLYYDVTPLKGIVWNLKQNILDILEIIRSRWHLSIAINCLLDRDIEELRLTSELNYAQILRDLIRRKRQFGLFLNDPVPYNFDASQITDISERAQRELWLQDLREMTFRKFEILEGLFNNCLLYANIGSRVGGVAERNSNEDTKS